MTLFFNLQQITKKRLKSASMTWLWKRKLIGKSKRYVGQYVNTKMHSYPPIGIPVLINTKSLVNFNVQKPTPISVPLGIFTP